MGMGMGIGVEIWYLGIDIGAHGLNPKQNYDL